MSADERQANTAQRLPRAVSEKGPILATFAFGLLHVAHEQFILRRFAFHAMSKASPSNGTEPTQHLDANVDRHSHQRDVRNARNQAATTMMQMRGRRAHRQCPGRGRRWRRGRSGWRCPGYAKPVVENVRQHIEIFIVKTPRLLARRGPRTGKQNLRRMLGMKCAIWQRLDCRSDAATKQVGGCYNLFVWRL